MGLNERRRYSSEFKRNAVYDFWNTSSDVSVSEFARQQGIPRETLRDWINQHAQFTRGIPKEGIVGSMQANNNILPQYKSEVATRRVFSELPWRTSEWLKKFTYKGKGAAEYKLHESLYPTQIFFITGDFKLPEDPSKSAKILEINGPNSGLKAYPDGVKVPLQKVSEILGTFDKPIISHTNLFGADWYTIRDFSNIKVIDVRDWDDEYFYPVRGNRNTFEAFQRIIWNPSPDHALSYNRRENLVLNDVPFCQLEKKLSFSLALSDRGLNRFRPKSWYIDTRNLSRKQIDTSTRELVDVAMSEDRESEIFVLKPDNESQGRGVTFITREKLPTYMSDVFTGGENRDTGVSGVLYQYYKPDIFMLEGYVPNKPIQSTADGKLYDPTMRIALMGFYKDTRLAMVPVCAYWKMPKASIDQALTHESMISNINQSHPSERVSEEDFARTYATFEAIIPSLMDGIKMGEGGESFLRLLQTLHPF